MAEPVSTSRSRTGAKSRRKTTGSIRTRARAAGRTTATTSSTRTSRVCPQCGHHFPVRARERIAQLADGGTFVEEDAELHSADPLELLRPARLHGADRPGRDADRPRRRDRRRRGRDRAAAPASSRSWTSPSWAARWGASSARSSPAPASARPSGSVPLVTRHRLGRRADAGGDPLAHAAAEDGLRGGRAARGALAVRRRHDPSDDGRRARELREPRRRDRQPSPAR